MSERKRESECKKEREKKKSECERGERERLTSPSFLFPVSEKPVAL